jgi:hypothetical protein
MDYNMEDIKTVLGDKFNPGAEYVLETHRGAAAKKLLDWVVVGEVPDSTDNDQGTMVIMEKASSIEDNKSEVKVLPPLRPLPIFNEES